jgi:hypothetical protein
MGGAEATKTQTRRGGSEAGFLPIILPRNVACVTSEWTLQLPFHTRSTLTSHACRGFESQPFILPNLLPFTSLLDCEDCKCLEENQRKNPHPHSFVDPDSFAPDSIFAAASRRDRMYFSTMHPAYWHVVFFFVVAIIRWLQCFLKVIPLSPDTAFFHVACRIGRTVSATRC